MCCWCCYSQVTTHLSRQLKTEVLLLVQVYWKGKTDMFEAKTIMKTEVASINKNASIYDAISLLVENDITGLPVTNDDGTMAGIISEKDMLRLLYEIEDKEGSVEEFMTKEVVCFDRNDSLIDIVESFNENNFRRVPIVHNGKPIGIISRKDIIEYILKLRRKNKVTV